MVIAIIGILASIVLVTFPSATKRAKDSRIVSAIGQARTVMTYAGSNDGDYDAFGTACASGIYYDETKPLCDEVTANGGTLTIVIYPASNSTSACIYSALNLGGRGYCADSLGYAGAATTVAAIQATCAAGTSAYCPAGLFNP